MKRFLPLGLAAVVAWSLASVAPASACFRIPPDLSGYPMNDSVGVPLDAVLIYQARNRVPSHAVLSAPLQTLQLAPSESVASVRLASADGAVDVTVRDATKDHFEVVPAQALAPNTLYTLTVKWVLSGALFDARQPSTLRFTTGSDPSRVELTPPQVALSSYSATPRTSCDSLGPVACVSAADDETYLVQIEGYPYLTLVQGSFFQEIKSLGLPLSDAGMPPDAGTRLVEASIDCMHIRRRVPNGQLSEPIRVCISDAPQYDIDLLVDPDAAPLEESEGAYRLIDCDQDGLKLNEKLVSEQFDDEGKPIPEPPEEELSDAGLDTPADDASPARDAVNSNASCSMRNVDAPPTWAFGFLAGVGALVRRRRHRRDQRAP